MLSKKAKVLQTLAGKTFLEHILSSADAISDKVSIVVGFDKHAVEKKAATILKKAKIYEQKDQIGTADAVKTVIEFVDENEKVLILYGDVPLIRKNTLKKLFSLNDSLSILTANVSNPTGYGRVLKDSNGLVQEIIEEKDTNDEQKNIKEIFTGVMAVNGKILRELIPLINNNNASKEYYLTDLIGIANGNGFKIETLSEAGVDCTIDVNVIFEGKVELGNNVSIGANTIISNTKIGDNSEILPFSHIDSSQIGKDCFIGPYARLREGSEIADGARIGNFVETKKTKIGQSTKANHFTYLGDTEIGNDVNIGAGTITCNYDGKNKNKTEIGDGSFIGTNASLIAPVSIGKNAYVGAGSTITKDVPDSSLGISRSKQKNVKDWSKNKK